MIEASLNQFWNQHEAGFGGALRQGFDRVVAILAPEAAKVELQQIQEDLVIAWHRQAGIVEALFFYIADPRDLSAVATAFTETKARNCPLTYVFIHQWTDGEGNWDVFTITPARQIAHHNRFWGSEQVPIREPILRHEIYELFSVRRAFPRPGCAGWAKLLAGPRATMVNQLSKLAGEYRLRQAHEDGLYLWRDHTGAPAALLCLLPDPADIDSFIHLYQQIEAHACPVTLLFLACERDGLFDIFRLSARSYLEHHNQAKVWAQD